MKKIFVFLMVMLVLFSLTACGSSPITDEAGNELKNGEVMFDNDAEFVVSKIYMTDSKYGEGFYALFENDEYKFLAETSAKLFVEYPEGSVIKGHFVVTYDKIEKALDSTFAFEEHKLYCIYCAEK